MTTFRSFIRRLFRPAPHVQIVLRTAPAPPKPRTCPCGGACGFGFNRPADEHVYGRPACLQD